MIFRHFRCPGSRVEAVTVCYEEEVISDEKCNHYMGIAFCSPKEQNFVKSIGRLISSGRLQKVKLPCWDAWGTQIWTTNKPYRKEEIWREVVKRLNGYSLQPSWFVHFNRELREQYEILEDQ